MAGFGLWKGILLHGLHQNAASLCHRALFLGFGLNSSYMCGYILKVGTNLA